MLQCSFKQPIGGYGYFEKPLRSLGNVLNSDACQLAGHHLTACPISQLSAFLKKQNGQLQFERTQHHTIRTTEQTNTEAGTFPCTQ